MASLLAEAARTVTESRSPLGFSTTGSAAWPEWDRYLTVDGRPAYHLGNICGTCSFLFERLPGASSGIDVGELTDGLAQGLDSLRPEATDVLAALMPAGDYRILLLRLRPHLVLPGGAEDYFSNEQVENEVGADPFWGLPHHPKVPYYRIEGRSGMPLPSTRAEPGRGFEFLVPMFPETFLDRDRSEFYDAAFAEGRMPTAVALSVLDVKGPATGGIDHWCLAHYVVDGHHKVAAAARAGAPLGLLAFVATRKGTSSYEQVETFIASYD
jgi:hypothetical protein